MDLEMDHATSLKLIKLYESHPALWDRAHEGYYDKKIKLDNWKEIGAAMERPAECVKRKIVNLTGTYRRFKWRCKQSPKYAKCRWYAYDAFAFLESSRRRPAHRIEVAEEEEEEIEQDDVGEAADYVNNVKSESISTLHEPPAAAPRGGAVDECGAFGEYVAQTLRKHGGRTRAIIKHAINNIIFEQEMKMFQVNPLDD